MSVELLVLKIQELTNQKLTLNQIREIILQLKEDNLNNSDFIKKAKSIFSKVGITLKTTELYEFFSKSIGEKNWNIVKSKNLEFYSSLFNHIDLRTGNPLLDEDLKLIGKGSVITISGNPILSEKFMYQLSTNFIKNSKKVLHLSFSKIHDEVLPKYQEKLSDLKLESIRKDDLSELGREYLSKVNSHYKDNLRVMNYLDREIKQDQLLGFKYMKEKFDFDVIMLVGEFALNVSIYHLQKASRKLNCLILVQGSQSKKLEFHVRHGSDVVMEVNEDGKLLEVLLNKNSLGPAGKKYQIK